VNIANRLLKSTAISEHFKGVRISVFEEGKGRLDWAEWGHERNRVFG
jgi:hypothetical protein